MKTNELAGPALDWAVAKCEGFAPFTDGISWIIDDVGTYKRLPKYSTDWAQGGPIIEQEKIGFKYTGAALDFVAWVNGQLSTKHDKYGETPLIAAMRCYVASKLGDQVDVPKELTI